jgi:osmotically-inducible protein OsmY
MELKVYNRLLLLVLTVGLGVLVPRSGQANPGALSQEGIRRGDVLAEEVQLIKDAIDGASIVGWYSVSFVSLPEKVVLQGLVDSQTTSDRIEGAVRGATRKRIANELKLRPRLEDDQVRKRVIDTLRTEYPVLYEQMQVSVENGTATVSGDLRSRRQVDEVLATILMIEGVRDIQSDLSVGGNPYVGYAMSRWQ